MVTRGVSAVVVAALAGVVVASAAGTPRVVSVVTVDRTLLCTVDGTRAQRQVGVSATTRTANTPATIYANHSGGLASVFAGVGSNSGLGFRVQTPPMSEWLWLNRKRCARSNTKLPFTSRGLAGGRVAFFDSAECAAPRRLLVRIRATFVRDTGLATLDAMFVARTQVRRAELAVAEAVGRRPVAYLRLDSPLRVSLFVRNSCTRY